MAITHYRDRSWLSPWRELDQVANRLQRIVGDGIGGDAETIGWVPPVSVEETRDELVLTAELPGLGENDVEIEIENQVLTIRGRKEARRDETSDERRFHVWERSYGSFARSFSLPRSVSADKIQAAFQDGVLHVRMPKAPEAKGRKIEIRPAK